MHSCITALIIAFLHIHVAEANYFFSIHIASFSNPENRLANGSCCNGTTEEGICMQNCKIMLRFCLRAAGHPQHDKDTCPSTEIKGNASPRVINPFVEGPWEGSGQLHIGVTESGTDQLIDNLFIELNLTANGPFTPTESFIGLLDQATIELQFRLFCAFEYFGMDCNTFCVDRNDTNAHYTCGDSGEIVCLQGYQNESSNCTQCAPAEGCSSTNGFCNGPGECLCQDGWRGEHCDECIPADGCSPTGGVCISPGECICQDGYSGNTCHIEPVIPSTSTQSNIIITHSSLPATSVAVAPSSSLQMFALAVSSIPVVFPSSSIIGSARQVSNTMKLSLESPSSTQLALPVISIAANPSITTVALPSPSFSEPSVVARLSTLAPYSTPPTSSTGNVGSESNTMFAAVGVGVGIGGILLILLVLATITLAVVTIYQRKKKRGQFWFEHREMNLSTEELMRKNSINSGKSIPDCQIIGQALYNNHPVATHTKNNVKDDFELATVDSTTPPSMEKEKGQGIPGGNEEKGETDGEGADQDCKTI